MDEPADAYNIVYVNGSVLREVRLLGVVDAENIAGPKRQAEVENRQFRQHERVVAASDVAGLLLLYLLDRLRAQGFLRSPSLRRRRTENIARRGGLGAFFPDSELSGQLGWTFSSS